jgi:hypothetical protein
MRIRQIVFAAADLRAGASLLRKLLDLHAPYRDPGVAEFGLDNAVFVFGDQFVEIVSPTQAGTTAGRLVERRGDCGYMLILQTDDFDRELARFQQLGVRRVWAKDLDDIRAMHLHPKDIGGAIVSIDQPMPPASWRWGGPGWTPQPGAAGEQRVVGVSVGAEDPEAMARRWAEVLGMAAPAAHGATPAAGRRLDRFRAGRCARGGHLRLCAGRGRPRRRAGARPRPGPGRGRPHADAVRHPRRAALAVAARQASYASQSTRLAVGRRYPAQS